MLPALGVLALLLLVAGTLVGIGALMGLIGGRNYLAKADAFSGNKVSAAGESGVVMNEI
jgi:hypothetical protein